MTELEELKRKTSEMEKDAVEKENQVVSLQRVAEEKDLIIEELKEKTLQCEKEAEVLQKKVEEALLLQQRAEEKAKYEKRYAEAQRRIEEAKDKLRAIAQSNAASTEASEGASVAAGPYSILWSSSDASLEVERQELWLQEMTAMKVRIIYMTYFLQILSNNWV